MPELQIDVTVANRFISSLSKSLQALCHGCMDFDNGIEIVGYINISIDSGSKVDYVLNEKVLKSTTNSMTFVSNSFLAKKEHPKQTRDGCCSPVPELQVHPSPYSASPQGTHMGSQYHRFAHQFSPHPRVMRGSQKRSWTGDWRMNLKKQRLHLSGEVHHALQHAQSTSQSPSESGFKQPQIPTATDTGVSDDTQQLVNVKKELETDNETLQSEHSTSQGEVSGNEMQESSSDILSKIKADPDALPSNDDTSHSEENTLSGENKDSFLQPSLSNPEQFEQESTDKSKEKNTNQQFPSDLPAEQAMADDQSASSHSNANMPETDVPYESEQSGSDMPEEFPEATDEGSYSQQAYSDLGEGSSDAGQFEVIEIDDEDEDVQAMLNDPHGEYVKKTQIRGGKSRNIVERFVPESQLADTGNRASATRNTELASSSLGVFPGRMNRYAEAKSLQCRQCSEQFTDHFSLTAHLSEFHNFEMPFCCSVCGKGYLSSTGLNLHMETHTGKSYMCPICDSRFTQKGTIKLHLRSVHKMAQCVVCLAVFRLGSEYNQHVLHCQ